MRFIVGIVICFIKYVELLNGSELYCQGDRFRYSGMVQKSVVKQTWLGFGK